jgi:hypothetical protein
MTLSPLQDSSCCLCDIGPTDLQLTEWEQVSGGSLFWLGQVSLPTSKIYKWQKVVFLVVGNTSKWMWRGIVVSNDDCYARGWGSNLVFQFLWRSTSGLFLTSAYSCLHVLCF